MAATVTTSEDLKIIRGNVSAEGKRTAGHGFKVLKMSTGKYGISFNTDFAETPTIVATVYGDGYTPLDNALIADINTDQAVIHTCDSEGHYADRPFTFIAMG